MAGSQLSQLPVEIVILSDAPNPAKVSQMVVEVIIDTSIIPSTEATQFIIVMP